MATTAQIEQELSTLRATLGQLEAARAAVNREIGTLTAEKDELTAAARKQYQGGDQAGAAALRAQAAQLEAKIGNLYSSPAFANLDAAESKIRSLESQLYQVKQKEEFDAKQNPPTASAAQTAQDDAAKGPTRAPESTINAEGRIQPVSTATAPTNADVPATTDTGGGDTGTNAPVRTLNQTQATSGQVEQGQGPTSATNSLNPNAATSAPFIGPGDDDASVYSTTPPSGGPVNGDVSVNAAFEKITAQPNRLDQYASSAWSASVYLLTTDQYKQLLNSKKKSINGYQLLFQSAGAPNNVGGAQGSAPAAGAPDAGRSPFFPNDFYIDSVTIDNKLPGKATRAAHLVTDLKFTVIEPLGITLLDRLYAAVQDFAPKNAAGAVNYTACQYLMVLRFYGYDENGNLIGGASSSNTGVTNNTTVIEKFIPFLIAKMNWSVGSKLVQYDFEANPVAQMIGQGVARGTIPADIQISNSTVGQLLSGISGTGYGDGSAEDLALFGSTAPTNPNAVANLEASHNALVAAAAAQKNNGGTTGAPPKASSAPTTKFAASQGLMAFMNQFQKQLVSDGIFTYADSYNIVFASGTEEIRDASIAPPDSGPKDKSGTNSAAPATVDPQNLLAGKTSVNSTIRRFALTAGQQLVQAIELAIRNSTYIYNQALTVVDADTGLTQANQDKFNKPVNWFKITMEARPKDYDRKRNDYAYDITFVISKYLLQDFDSRYFPATPYRGVHKSYPYWFTGQNTSVIDYTASFNHLYTLTVSGSSKDDGAADRIKRNFTSSQQQISKITYSPRSQESDAGAPIAPGGSANEVPASAAEYLYNPSGVGEAQLRIVGDPAWIQQGSLFAGVNPVEFNYRPFLSDGTINFDSQQVMYEVVWQRPEDFDLQSGLADPYSRTQKITGDRQPIQSYVYLATQCTSEFRGGKFEQVLHGKFYPIYTGNNKAPTAPTPAVGTGFGDGSAEDLALFPTIAPTGTRNPGGLAKRGLQAAPSRLSGQNPLAAPENPFSAAGALSGTGFGDGSAEDLALFPTIPPTAVTSGGAVVGAGPAIAGAVNNAANALRGLNVPLKIPNADNIGDITTAAGQIMAKEF